ncbi:hypothetical protein I302_103455 [Kwoniella bestiolae CBS 10118]|uniref:Uncharacterized protein n=1 Tax=Kwoniella bestiolae CBS 10118 TaxID=1296100 RepID=A0A1B9G8E8_9TREE|nr:hypothetical protein I302_02155 [Kwoniella bestiolae CBS 10118]OCF27314.1 hypothetical protein I302_02155 [Kwoniella bestiolae CBS 10118]
MASDSKDKNTDRHRSSGSGSGSGSSKHRSDRERSSRHGSGSGGRERSDPQKRVKDTAKTVGDGAGKAYSSVADLFGGEKELNRTIRRYNPTFYEFADKTFLKNFGLANKPSKFLLFIIALGLIQSFIPLFQSPLDFAARWLGFLLLFGTGTSELKEGFASSRKANKIKSLLTIIVLLSALQLIPNFLFDTYYHFGALWSFFLPVILFITPFKESPDQTLASILCDTFFGGAAMVLGGLIPDSMSGENGQNMAILAGVIVAGLFWIGYLGSLACYLIVWAFLSLSTINTLGAPFISKEDSSSGFYRQMKIWHCTMAIWLWRYLVSAIEGISIPGIISMIGLIQHYLPSYFLWMTGFWFAMLMTKKVEKRYKADTWYAKWLMGVSDATSPAVSSGSASGRSERQSSSARPSGSGQHRSSRSEKDKRSSKK